MAAVALASSAQPHKLRVGVFAGAQRQPRWVVEGFARLAAAGFAEIVLIAAGGPPRGRGLLPSQVPGAWLWRSYRALDRLAFGEAPAEPLELALSVPHERHFPLPEDQAALAAWRAEVAGLRLDVAFALDGVRDELLDGLARYGVWRYCFGEERSSDEPLAGFREVSTGELLTVSGLRVRAGPPAGERLAYHSCSRTYPFSVARNRSRVLAKTADFPLRALRELHRSGQAFLERCPHLAVIAPGGAAPRSGEILRHFGRLGARVARRALEKALYVEQWFLGYRLSDQPGWQDIGRYARLVPPTDRFWADPFALSRDGRHFIFFEELVFARGKAHIAMVEVLPDGRCTPPVTVLERGHHLSYPFLLEHDGALYMIPESAEDRSVEVFRCVEFPHRWRSERRLFQGLRLVDATFHREAGRWWMFANAPTDESSLFDDELHLFHAESLLGDWRAHPANPVKSDARSARPAGALYRTGGALYRPAQICVPRYGAGVSLNRVLRLTPHEYAERAVQRLLPGPADGLLGLHTVNRSGRLTVLDGFVRTPRHARFR